jgi:hypothetical protein
MAGPNALSQRKFAYWIKREAIRLREEAGVPVARIAAIAGVKERTIQRFEAFQGDQTTYPPEMDRYLDAYAEAFPGDEVRSAQDIYQAALRRWRDAGQPTRLSDSALLRRIRAQREHDRLTS